MNDTMGELAALVASPAMLEGSSLKGGTPSVSLEAAWTPRRPPFLFVLLCDVILMNLAAPAPLVPVAELEAELAAAEKDVSGEEDEKKGEVEEVAAADVGAELDLLKEDCTLTGGDAANRIREMLPPKFLLVIFEFVLAVLAVPTCQAPEIPSESALTVEQVINCDEEKEIATVAAVATDDDALVDELEVSNCCTAKVAHVSPTAAIDMGELKKFVENAGEAWHGEDDSYMVVLEAMALGLFVDDDGQAPVSEATGGATIVEEDPSEEEFWMCDDCSSEIEGAACRQSCGACLDEPGVEVPVC